MNRYNCFTLIHKALRACLYDTALLLQQTYFADVSEARPAIRRIESVVKLFGQHAHHEDEYILPYIASVDPQLVQSFENEHEKDEQLGNMLVNLIAIFKNTVSDEERLICGSALVKAFGDFLVFNLEHMAREEAQINPVLWKYYTDEELKELHARIGARLSPEEKGDTAPWIVRGINRVEAVRWLTLLKQTAPAPAFEAMLGLLEKELAPARAAVIRRELQPEEAFA